MEKRNMITNLDLACRMLEESFYADGNKKEKSIMEDFDPELFINRESVKKMYLATMKGLTLKIKNSNNVTNKDLALSESEILAVTAQFKTILDTKIEKLFEIDVNKAKTSMKVEMRQEVETVKMINDFGKDII